MTASARRTLLAAIFAVFSVAGLAVAAGPALTPVLRDHKSSAKDLLPLYLGAHALAAGKDPNDPAALEATYRALGMRMQVGGFFSYYPRTASVLAQPMRAVSFERVVQPFRFLLLACVVGAAAFGALAGAAGPVGTRTSTARRLVVLGLVAIAVAWTLSLRITAPILRTAQPGPLAAVCTGLGLWALARRRDGLAGAAIGIGASLKLFPMLLLASAARRGRVVAVALAVFAALFVAALALHPALGGDMGGVARFLTPDPTPAWEPPLLGLWRARLAIVPLTGAVVAWAAWRRVPPVAVGALAVAGGGVLLAGTQHPHEVIQLVPAVAFVLGSAARPGARRWEIALPVALLAVGAAFRVVGPPNHAPTLSFLPFALATWAACLARVVTEREPVAATAALPAAS